MKRGYWIALVLAAGIWAATQVRAQAPAGHRAVHVEVVGQARVRRRHDHRPPVDVHAQVADEPGIEHGMQVLFAIRALVGQAPEPDVIVCRAGIDPAIAVVMSHGTIVARRRGQIPASAPDRCRTTHHIEGELRSPRSVTP